MTKRWKPEHGEIYYFVNSTCDVSDCEWLDDSVDRLHYKNGNCFSSEEKAKASAEKVKALLLSLNYNETPTANDETLPDWCKVGEWVYYIPFTEYAKIEQMNEGFMLRFVDGDSTAIPRKDVDNLATARLRPYNSDELKALIGKVVGNEHGNMFLVTAFVTDDGGEVCVDGVVYNADDLLECYTIDGKPCGKLEHLEKGEWVE